MKLLTFLKDDRLCLGVQTEKGIVDVELAAARYGAVDAEIPTDMMKAIEGGQTTVTALQRLTDAVLAEAETSGCLLDELKLTLGPCVTQPNKIICVGLNYRKHAIETKAPIPDYPILFNKFNNALTGHGHPVTLPDVSQQVDYEAELAIVIGKTAKNVEKEHALTHVFGYCNANDLSARDLQLRTTQWLLGKTCDGFSPLGPYLVTAEEVDNPNNLTIKCFVNGEERQNSNTADMIFHCDEIVSYISKHMTLVPGDIILTGTPEGVVLGYPKDKRVYLQDGDIVTVEIEKLGSLTNRMVKEVV
ncbi:hypothetical protein J31TS4_28450 [Paenibacillus sp. J31TS4]|uniref:fumarylacetoacetate hydrolase family protein n=1 Tax=Paenibacillus sp. J31TS4 TaxID=2807195 RepID=UPI001B06B9CD|nr:fumarylacetoacetate hydrolase family protein [Paenibacillus sp. J31TS4]GIP39565.1 hypothetical protein J31TS4_28450 [Paenibacillus sp. J31TS4]